MDGHFPNHHPDPTQPENLQHLVDSVLANKADVGLAFDGDSDRLGAVDELGTILYGDQLMIIYGREILSRRPGATIIGEVKSSQNMYDELTRQGGNAIMWKTGHSLIKARMQETSAALAGEMSGHLFFADRYYGFDDALYAACRLLEIVANSAAPLSSQLSDLPPTFATPEIRVDCPDASKFGIVSAVRKVFERDYDVIAIDGARINFGQGWGLVRASNTQPVLVLRFEAQSPELLAGYRKLVEDAVAEASK
jgi:phosphomannomutase / phosphoglucomutase